MVTEFTTYVAGDVTYKGPSLEEAIRTWDATTYHAPAPAGGISVQTWDYAGGTMIRDGWILHVREDGSVYLNPRLQTT